ncbi:DegV family protein [Fusobacterium sp. PH5-44]|uniref:DegV family protein n=1 Tax=unclassified Fusobacterium TaxID=2648384 RepID=UPI003D1971BB
MKIEIKVLNPLRFTKLFIAASRWVSKYADVLNDLNVFPIPDGDTGTNISMTLQSVENELVKLDHEPKMSEFVDKVSEAIILGANGTSGIILGNIIVGFLSSIKDKELVTIDDVAHAFMAAKEKAYKAVTTPLEGTILTVVKVVAEEAINYKGDKDDFILFLVYLKNKAYEAVKKTTEQFTILKENGVVDAGAMGFFYLLEGFEKSVADPEMLKDLERIVKSQAIRSKRLKQVVIQNRKNKYKYNVEFLLESNNIDLGKYTRDISKYGDLLYCVSIGDKIKTQVNTDFPWEILKICDILGRVYNVKYESSIDDNKGEYQEEIQEKEALREETEVGTVKSKNLKFSNIAIVTDSASDLTEELIKTLEISVIPLKLKVDESYYNEGSEISKNEIWTLFRKELVFPKASPPSTTEFKNLYEELIGKGYEHIISIHISNKLSGTYQAAKIARDNLDEPSKVTIVDSETLSLPLSHLVLEAGKNAQSGMKCEDILKRINENIGKMKVFMFAEDLSYLEENNRVNKISHMWGHIFKSKPILRLEKERLDLIGYKLRTKSIMNYIKNLCEKETKNGKVIIYTLWGGSEKEFQKSNIVEEIVESFKDKVEFRGNFQLGNTIGIHCGPVFGIGIIQNNK